jgi:hypothetical protein
MWHNESFTWKKETRDKYGTISSTASTTFYGYNEYGEELYTSGDKIGTSEMSKGRIHTRSTLSFDINDLVTVDGVDYTIKDLKRYSIPGMSFQVIYYG